VIQTPKLGLESCATNSPTMNGPLTPVVCASWRTGRAQPP